MQEWCGQTASDGRFVIPFHAADNAITATTSFGGCNSPLFVAAGAGPGVGPRESIGTAIEMLDIKRVEDALAILHEEEDIADAMAGRPPRERKGGASGVMRPDSYDHDDSNVEGSTASERNGPEAPAGAGTRVLEGDAVGAGAVPTPPSVDRTENTNNIGGSLDLDSPDQTEQRGAAPNQREQSRKRWRIRDVLAVYRHRGAQLVLAQRRKRHPFRMDGVFCRPDRGEWAGQVCF